MKVIRFSSLPRANEYQYVKIPDGIYMLIFNKEPGVIRGSDYEKLNIWYVNQQEARLSPLGFFYSHMATAVIVEVMRGNSN